MLPRISLSLLLLFATSSLAAAADWPSFRGAAADGAIRNAVFESDQPLGLRVAWKRPLGSGYSSVSVAGGKAVTMYSDGERDHLIALDQATGHEHWQVDMGPTYHGHDGSHTGPISTPLIHDGKVFALGPFGRLLAVALDDGEVAWSVELAETLGAKKPHYGFSTAPLMVDGVLVVQVGGAEGSAFAGIDPATGEARWTTGDDGVANQSPVPVPVGESTAVMAVGDKKLVALHPETGEVFLEFEHEGIGARGVQSLMPVLAGDGRVFLAHRDNSSRMVRIGHGEDGAPTVESMWESSSIRNSYNVAVYHEGYVYAFSSRFLTCVDAETGEAAWKSRAPGDGFLMLVDGHLVIQTKDGSLHVARATPDGYQELASTELFRDELAWSPPGFADGSIYTRSLGEVARVDLVWGEAPTRMASSGGAVDLAGTRFGAFLSEVEAAADKHAVIEAFLAEQESFPIVEDGGLVHFVYYGEADDLALGGDMIGSRQEVPMTRIEETDLFYYSTHLEPDARVAYVFIKDYEELLDQRNPNQHMSTVYGRDMEMIFRPDTAIWMSWLAMPEWRAPDHVEEVAEEMRGSIDSHQLESEVLGRPVNLSIYLPRGYAESSDARYPVAYVYGGTVAQQAGRMGSTLDNLIGESIAPLIVAFVDAPMPPFQMAQYGEVLANEVVPFVDETYRTRAERDARASVGAGFPGYGAMFAAFTRRDTFGRIGVLSPLMLTSMRTPLEQVVPPADTELPVEIYFDWGKYDLRNPHENWDLAAELADFDGFLRERGYEPLGGETPEGAGWSGYRSRTDDLFSTLFPAR